MTRLDEAERVEHGFTLPWPGFTAEKAARMRTSRGCGSSSPATNTSRAEPCLSYDAAFMT